MTECPPNSTDCESNENYESSIDYLTPDQIAEVIIYVICFALAAPLNVVSLLKSLKAFKQHKAKSSILLFRINLNVADIMTILIFVPKQVIWIMTFWWHGGDILCKILAFFSTFSFYLNSFIIACIAVDRVYGAYNISSLTAHQKSYARCRTLLCFGWLLAFILSLPQIFIFQTYQPFPDRELEQCWSFWKVFERIKYIEFHQPGITAKKAFENRMELLEMKKWEKLYGLNHIIFLFWLPCLVIVCSYLTVLCILQGHLKDGKAVQSCCGKKRTYGSEDYHLTPPLQSNQNEESIPNLHVEIQPKNGSSSMNGSMQRLSTSVLSSENMLNRSGSQKKKREKLGSLSVTTIYKAKQHAKRQATWIILAYLLIWSPYNVYTLLNFIGAWEKLALTEYFENLSFLHAIICCNPIVNPIIYGLFQKPDRNK